MLPTAHDHSNQLLKTRTQSNSRSRWWFLVRTTLAVVVALTLHQIFQNGRRTASVHMRMLPRQEPKDTEVVMVAVGPLLMRQGHR